MRCGLLKATNDLQLESDPAMTPDQRRERIRDLTSLCANHPDEYGVLSSGERLMVAYTLNRIDWLRADGCSSLDAVRDRVGLDWWIASTAVKTERSGGL